MLLDNHMQGSTAVPEKTYTEKLINICQREEVYRLQPIAFCNKTWGIA